MRKNLLVFLALTIVSAFLVAGCGRSVTSTGSPVPQPQSQPQSQSQFQSQVQALLQKQGSGQANPQWPSAMPSYVPVFTYGTIYGSSNNVNGAGAIQAVFVNVDQGAFNKYQQDLKNAGWTITNALNSNNGFEIDAERNGRSLTTIMGLNMTVPGKGVSGALTLWPAS
jgi:hypothetical protein